MPTRRDMLKIAAVGAAAAVLPLERIVSAATAAEPVAAIPFAHPMPVPQSLTPSARLRTHDLYDVTMRETQAEIVRGVLSPVRTYNGQFPGPTIRAKRGRPAVVRQTNALGVDTSVHLHGAKLPADQDGHPTDVIAPGGNRTYTYDNDQPAASLWYHDHAHHQEATNVYAGLAGAYLLGDGQEAGLGLPSGQFDVPLQIRDARVEQGGALVYTRASARPHMLVNGKERPYFAVSRNKYRLRVYNTSIDRYLKLRFADGRQFQQIGTDGGLLPAPLTATELALSAGERADIVVDFATYAQGASVVLQNTAALATENADVLRFDIARPQAPQLAHVPRRLADLPSMAPATVERSITLATDPVTSLYTINGLTYDPNRVDVSTPLGTTEIWTITNADTAVPPPNFHVHHNFHTHLANFRVLSRNGGPPAPGETGVKDTVMVAPGDTVRITMTWAGHKGKFVYHCHQLPHAAEAQMATIEIT
ncbi:multicopper oxidase family protein [Actinokineospora sp. G85]|uniref:multicopper oxidase family protein n=1 Tax=Actinokineospora sp. G85 TaxID=3406626 RepID=UPI003C70C661